jgi:hypothetical protein
MQHCSVASAGIGNVFVNVCAALYMSSASCTILQDTSNAPTNHAAAVVCRGNNVRVMGGATSAVLGSPRNVVAGKGIIHNINNVLLPTINLTTLAKMTGCKVTL